jgi:hypothetical protein
LSPRIDRVVNVFYSSTTADVTFEKRKAFKDACDTLEIALSTKIHIIDWKTNIAGGVGARSGQDVIDRAVKGQYDIYFGCLGAQYGKGTIGEYEKAIAGYIRIGSRPRSCLALTKLRSILFRLQRILRR